MLGAASFLLLQHLTVSLDRTLDGGLRARAADLVALVEQADAGLREAPRTFGGGTSFAQVLTPGGRIFDASRGFAAAPLLRGASLRRARTAPLLVPRARVRSAAVRLLAVPVRAQDRRLVVVVGAPLRARDEAVASLRGALLVGGPVALALVSAVGYLLAAAALRPVERMRVGASSISERRLAERLPVPDTRDELGRLGETLNEMLARIERGVERERRFLADASHELRSPLALLRAEVDLALEGRRSAAALRAALQSVGVEADRLSQLADDLLLLARLDEGRLPLRVEHVEVRRLLDDVVARFARRAQGAGRALTAECGGEAVRGDRLRLEQALSNLVENALRHGAGTVTLSARSAGEHLELSVRDEGAGFPASFAATAFERFARADAARSAPGAGLGLAIVRAIVEAHGGSVSIEGAAVRLALPGAHEARP